MGTDGQTLQAVVLAFQAGVVLSTVLISIFMAHKLGLRKRWGFIGFPILVVVSQGFRIISPALRFLEPMVTKLVQPFGQSGVIGLLVVTTFIVFFVALGFSYLVLKMVKNRGHK